MFALCFAVSCPGNVPILNLETPSSSDADIQVPQGQERIITVRLSLLNDVFDSANVYEGALVNWFSSTNSEKLEIVKAEVKTLSPASNAYSLSAKQKMVNVGIRLTVNPKGLTYENESVKVTIKIPSSDSKGIAYTQSKKEIVASDDIRIAIVKEEEVVKTPVNVKIKEGATLEFIEKTQATQSVVLELDGGTFYNTTTTTGITVKNGENELTNIIPYLTISDDKTQLTVKLASTEALTLADGGNFVISIPSDLIEPDGTHKVENPLTSTITVNVSALKPIEIKFHNVGSSDVATITTNARTALDRTIGVEFTGATVNKDNVGNVSISSRGTATTSNIALKTSVSSSEGLLNLKFTATDSLTTTDSGVYEIRVPKDVLTVETGYENKDIILEVTITVKPIPVKIKVKESSIEVEQGKSVSTTVTLIGGEWVKVPSIEEINGVTFSFIKTSSSTLEFTITASSSADLVDGLPVTYHVSQEDGEDVKLESGYSLTNAYISIILTVKESSGGGGTDD